MVAISSILEIVQEKNPEELKDFLEDGVFNNLSNADKFKLLTTEDELGCSILTIAAAKSSVHLSIILNNKALSGLDEDQVFKLISQPVCGNDLNLLNLAIRSSTEHIHALLDSQLISKLTQMHLLSFLNGVGVLEQPLQESIKTVHMTAMLDNEAVERLEPDALLNYLTGNGKGQPITLAMKKSIDLMKGFLNSKTIERLDSTKIFEFLNMVTDKIESNSIIWHTMVDFTCEHIYVLFNSKVFDRLSSVQIDQILTYPYARSNEETLLNYALNHKPLVCVQALINSHAFRKLGFIEVEKQFKIYDAHHKTVFDIALSKSPDHLGVLLDNGLRTLSDNQKINLLKNSGNQGEMSPVQKIVEHSQGLAVLVNSTTFTNLDLGDKKELLGEKLFDQISSCLIEGQLRYDSLCINDL